MIVIGIGSNLAGPGFASPLATAQAAVLALPEIGVMPVRRSRWYLTEPVPRSDQPWFANAVILVESDLAPLPLLEAMLALEQRFMRRRGARNAARTLDLDLLDYDGIRCESERLVLPHPRMHERRFVLAPLTEIAPEWRHPLVGVSARALLGGLPPGQELRVLGEAEEPPR